MRVLLMIGNNNIGVRELYRQVLDSRFPGWGSSNMSGLPTDPAAIVGAYDALVYELGAPDDPRRFTATRALWDEIKGTGTPMITHIEGPFREGVEAELEALGVICVAAPFSPDTIAAAFRRVAPAPTSRPADAGEAGARGRGRGLRGLFGRKK